MQKETITLTIEKLAGLGDGLGTHEDRKVYVPYTLAGDVVRARIVRTSSDVDYAALEAIITPGKDRIAPVCRHFSVCGGCALQHVQTAHYSEFKQQMAREAVRKAGFDIACVEPIIIMPAASRRRAELKIKNGKLGYHAERSHQLVDISECKVLEPELETLVMELKKQLTYSRDIVGVQINGVDGGYDVVVDEEAEGACLKIKAACMLRLSARHKGKIRTVDESAPVTLALALGGVSVAVPPGAFLQASRVAQAQMTKLVGDAVAGAARVLDLFAGIGTYSFPLAAGAQVTAIEGEGTMVTAMKDAAAKAGLEKKFTTEERDLFYNPLPAEKLKEYDAVIINPPRAGAKAQCEQLAQSQVKKIVMVSCNPATFARDARTLKDAGYSLTRLTPIDQFVYSSHLELVAEFVHTA